MERLPSRVTIKHEELKKIVRFICEGKDIIHRIRISTIPTWRRDTTKT